MDEIYANSQMHSASNTEMDERETKMKRTQLRGCKDKERSGESEDGSKKAVQRDSGSLSSRHWSVAPLSIPI